MNKVVLMLFVGVVFVAASVNATTITLNGAKIATSKALQHYMSVVNAKGVTPYWEYAANFDGKYFKIRCFEIRKEDVGSKDLKCGFDNAYSGYMLEANQYLALRAWFKLQGEKTGTVMAPEYKASKGQYQVNAVYEYSTANFKLNFHIPVTKPKRRTLLEMLQQMLLTRARKQ